jgi:hypothetical protein
MRRRAILAIIAATTAVACGGMGETSIQEPASPAKKNALTPEPGRKYDQEHRWELTDPRATRKLEGTQWGEQEITEFWTRKGWRLTKHEEHYMATVDDLARSGKVVKISHWGMVPFDPIYQTIQRVTIDGVTIEPQTEFWLDMNENMDELKVGHPRFSRVNQYEEEHQGHVDQASDGHDPGGHHHHDHDD